VSNAINWIGVTPGHVTSSHSGSFCTTRRIVRRGGKKTFRNWREFLSTGQFQFVVKTWLSIKDETYHG
jgi:hypothetical protein